MQMNISDRKKGKGIHPIFLLMLIIFISVLGYTLYKNINKDTQEEENQNNEQQEEVTPPQQEEEEEPIPEGPAYEELFPIIDEQQAYVVVPTEINSKNPPILILYSHGSNTTVTQNMSDQFMLDLQQYGIFFTKENLIFGASNQHGVNWGNTASIQDTLNLKNWVSENYSIQPKIYLIGFSMGGLPTMNFATTYPELISKIALLAPTTKSAQWDKGRAEKLDGIDIKLWHGNKDVNVPYSYSVSFVNKLKGYGKDIEFITVDGKGHFDIDTEYMQDILDFFLAD